MCARRLVAIRLQYDVMGVENLVVARTDSEAATLLTTNIDERDHAFILGSTTSGRLPLSSRSCSHSWLTFALCVRSVCSKGLKPLVQMMNEAERTGTSGAALQAVEDKSVSISL